MYIRIKSEGAEEKWLLRENEMIKPNFTRTTQ